MVLSGALGVALAIVYGLASTLINSRALEASSQKRFMAIVVGGIMVRFIVVFCTLLMGLFLLSLHPPAFVISFLGAFISALAIEMKTLHAQASAYSEELPA